MDITKRRIGENQRKELVKWRIFTGREVPYYSLEAQGPRSRLAFRISHVDLHPANGRVSANGSFSSHRRQPDIFSTLGQSLQSRRTTETTLHQRLTTAGQESFGKSKQWDRFRGFLFCLSCDAIAGDYSAFDMVKLSTSRDWKHSNNNGGSRVVVLPMKNVSY